MNALFVEPPRASPVPLVVAVPHAGRVMPAAIQADLGPRIGLARALEDPWVDALLAGATSVGAWRLGTAWARAVADVNRAADEFAGDQPMRGFRATPKARAGLGVVPTRVRGVALYERPLSVRDIHARLDLVHRPYHAALAELLSSVRASFGSVVLLDCHSMPESAGAAGIDVVLGDCFGRSARAATTALLGAAFHEQGLRTLKNAPYAGGYVTQHYGRPAAGVEVVQVELRRGLYMDERRFERSRGFAPLLGRLTAVLEAVANALAAKSGVPIALAGE